MKGCSKPLFCLQKKSVYVILNLHICMQIQENYRGIIMGRALGVTAMRGSDFDPDGSYTGVCDNIYEKPVQDADDL